MQAIRLTDREAGSGPFQTNNSLERRSQSVAYICRLAIPIERTGGIVLFNFGNKDCAQDQQA
jgi:hypothetical protein